MQVMKKNEVEKMKGHLHGPPTSELPLPTHNLLWSPFFEDKNFRTWAPTTQY